MSFKKLFRALMCMLCALLFVLNSRGPQRAAAEGAPEVPAAPVPSAAQLSAAYRRMRAQKPAIDIRLPEYALYGAGHPVGELFFETQRVAGVPVDARIAPDLRALLAAAREKGLNVYLSCGYIDPVAAEHVYRRTVEKVGEFRARVLVDRPGENEHESGLAVDITDRYYEEKDESLEDTELFTWLKLHSCDYGFILRYPKDKKEITGHVYQPWHFRYVGVEAAVFITENHLTLEEFLDLYRVDVPSSPISPA